MPYWIIGLFLYETKISQYQMEYLHYTGHLSLIYDSFQCLTLNPAAGSSSIPRNIKWNGVFLNQSHFYQIEFKRILGSIFSY